MKASLQVILFASLVPPFAGQDECRLCPPGSNMTLSDVPIPPGLFDTQGVDISTCGAIDSALGLLATISPAICGTTIQPFLDAFSAQYYCGCSGVDRPANITCSVCETLPAEAEAFVVPEGPFSNFTCGEAVRFFNSVRDPANCDTGILGLLCCPALPPQTEVPDATSAPTGAATEPEPGTEEPAVEPTQAPEETTAEPTQAPAEDLPTQSPTGPPLGSTGLRMDVANVAVIGFATTLAMAL